MDTLEKPTYEKDFVLWLEHQAVLLRQGRVDELDLESLIGEVEATGRGDKREVYNRLTVLALQFQVDSKCRWLRFQDSPRLAENYASAAFGDTCQDARQNAGDKTEMNTNPETCSYLEQTLDENFRRAHNG